MMINLCNWISIPPFLNGYFLVGFLILIIVISYGFIPCYQVWTSGFNYPKPVLPFFGNIFTIYRHGFQGSQLIWAATGGRCYAVAQSQTMILDISDPLLLKNILVKDFANFTNRRIFPITTKGFRKSIFLTADEEWKLGRKLILPTFTSHKIKTNMFPLMVQAAEQMVKHMLELIHKNDSRDCDNPSAATTDTALVRTIDAKEFYGCYTMDTIASTAFGLDLDSYDEKNHEFVNHAKIIFSFEAVKPLFAILGLFPFLARLLSYLNYSITDPKHLEFFADVVKESIKKRKTSNIKRNDYLQLLIDATYNEQISSGNLHGDLHHTTNGHISRDAEISSEIMNKDNLLDIKMEMTEREEDLQEDKSRFEKFEFKKCHPIYSSAKSNGSIKMGDSKTCSGNDFTSRENDGLKVHNRKYAQQPQQARATGFTEEQMISNALLFFIAGYESTANALSWISRVLAWYPDVQDRVKEEIFQKINHRRQKSSRQSQTKSLHQLLTYEDIMDLNYLDCVIKEVLRLYPPILFFDRVARNDYVIDDPNEDSGSYRKNGSRSSNKLIIKKGTIVEVPVYALHRDENLWTDPDTFDPGRFMNDRGDSTMDFQYQYMPFGFGPRNCIGLRFALLEIKVGLVAILASGIKLVPAPCDKYRDLTPENTQFRIIGINFPRGGIKIGLTLDE